MLITIAVVFVILTIISVPLCITGGIATSISLLIFNEELINPLMAIIQRMQFGVDNYTLLAIPLFILCGSLMNTSGITDRIFNLAQVLVGPIPGGLAHANVVASVIFAGMSGSMVGDAGGLGQVEIKAMRDRGYEADFACAVTAASSTIGPVIPPSVTMLLISGITMLSPGKLFLGGILPGFLMGISLMMLIFFMAKRNEYPSSPKPTAGEIGVALRKAVLPILTPVIIVGGIAGGVFAVTEAAAVACLYASILGFLVYKELKFTDLPKVLLSTMMTTAQIMFIVSTVAAISFLLIHHKFTETVGHFIFSVTEQPWQILLMFNLLVLFLGALIEGAALILLIVPIFLPLMEQIGIDPIHFGIFMAINVLIGGITPPIGMALFVIAGVANIKVEKLFKSIVPFLVPLIAVLFLVTYVEWISMAIPRWLMGR